MRDPETLRRIRSLAVPPAWTEVWISPLPNGHLQASGRDARGRKQYRYHPAWRAMRDETKYARMLSFSEALPRIRARVEQDLAKPGLPREKVLAAVVRLLERTRIRVGNEEYARENGSFGLTTLRSEHVDVDGATLRFEFRGKSGKLHTVALADRRLARIVQRCQEVPGHELFHYVGDDGESHVVDSADVNDYVRDASGEDFTAKDFRTWAGTVLTATQLREVARKAADVPARQLARSRKQHVVRAIAHVAEQLGNTPAVCRKSYVHPVVLETYLETGELPAPPATGEGALAPAELATVALLRERLKREMPSTVAA